MAKETKDVKTLETDFKALAAQVDEILLAGEPGNIRSMNYGDATYYFYDALEVKLALSQVFGLFGFLTSFDAANRCCSLQFLVNGTWTIAKFHFGTSDFPRVAYDQAFLNACYEFGIALRSRRGDLAPPPKEQTTEEEEPSPVLKEEFSPRKSLASALTESEAAGYDTGNFVEWFNAAFPCSIGEAETVLSDAQLSVAFDRLKTVLAAQKAKLDGADILAKVKAAFAGLSKEQSAAVGKWTKEQGFVKATLTPKQAQEIIEHINKVKAGA